MISSPSDQKASYQTSLFRVFFLIPFFCFLIIFFSTKVFLKEDQDQYSLHALQQHFGSFHQQIVTPKPDKLDLKNCLLFLTGLSNHEALSQLSLFSKEGGLLCSIYKDQAIWKEFFSKSNGISLSPDILSQLKGVDLIQEIQKGEKNDALLYSTQKINAEDGTEFYIEKTFTFQKPENENKFVLLFSGSGDLLSSTHSDFLLYEPEQQKKLFLGKDKTLLHIFLRDKKYNYLCDSFSWGNENLTLVYGIQADIEKNQMNDFMKRFLLLFLGFLFIFFILAQRLSKYFSSPLLQLNSFAKQIFSKNEFVAYSSKKYKEFAEISENLNNHNMRAFEDIKNLKKRVLELENAQKNLNKSQEDMISMTSLIRTGEQAYIIFDNLQKGLSAHPEKWREHTQAALNSLQFSDEPPSEVDLDKQIEFELADLSLKGRFTVSVQRNYKTVPRINVYRNEVKMAFRKLLADLLESINSQFPLNITIDADADGKIYIYFDFSAKNENLHLLNLNLYKSLFLKNKINLEIFSATRDTNEQTRISLWTNLTS